MSLRSLLLALVTSINGCSEAQPSTNLGPGGDGGGGGSPAGAGGTFAGTPVAQSGAGGSSGASSGGVAAAGASSGGLGGGTGGTTGGVAAGAAGMGGATVTPSVSKNSETKLSDAGLSLVSFGGYLNGESFQQEGIVSHRGYQYTAFWNTSRHVVMARRALPVGAWASFEFTDYTNTEADAHNTISLGITEGDGTLHVAFDHHVSPLHYRKSRPGLLSEPANAIWAAASFDATTSSLVVGANVAQLTYPRFVSEPGGQKTLLSARLGSSGSGDEYLWEYSATSHAWISLGKYLDGIVDNINAYLHGLSYAPGGTRLHAAWCWRDTSDAATNHDLLYAYSDDNGRSWQNDVGAVIGNTGGTAVRASSSGLQVWKIGQSRGLINTEHMIADAAGRVHVLLSHLPDGVADDTSFDNARTKSQYFHYWRGLDGKWTRTALALPAVAAFRGKLASSSSGNLYAILPDMRIAAAPASSGFKTWSLLERSDQGRFFSDPLIDSARLLTEDALSVFYPQKSSANIYVLDFALK